MDAFIENTEPADYVKNRERNGEGEKSILKRLISILGNGTLFLLLVIMAVLVFSMVQTRLTGAAPGLAGYQMYIVQGGSMSPTFEMGSLAFVRSVDPRELTEGAIITYHSSEGKTLTTHRITEVHNEDGQVYFTTRGDANNINDWLPVYPEDIIGQVVGTIPYVGYLMHFAQTKAGIVLLVFIPGAIIACCEIRNLLRYATEWEKEKAKQKADI